MRELLDGDFPHGGDFTVIAQAVADSAAVVSGCSVDDGGTNDMSVSVASGTSRIGGSKVSVGAQSVTLAASDATYDRYDLVVVDGTGSASRVTGTASSTPTAPSIPANSALLAIVHVAAGVSGVTNADIKDARAVYSTAQDFADHTSNASDHHARPKPGKNITEDANGNFNVPDMGAWVKDGSVSVSLAADATYSLNAAYDRIAIVIHDATGDNSSDANNDLNLSLDGVTSGYDLMHSDGTTTTGVTHWFFGPNAYSASFNFSGIIHITGQTTVRMANDGVGAIKSRTPQVGRANNVTPPVDSFRMWYDSGNITLEADVMGWSP